MEIFFLIILFFKTTRLVLKIHLNISSLNTIVNIILKDELYSSLNLYIPRELKRDVNFDEIFLK